MSDLYLRVIPTDPHWQPTVEAAENAAEYVAGLFAGPRDHVESVRPLFYERVTLIDGGQYMAEVFCPRCEAAIGLDWFWDVMRQRNGGEFADATFGDDLDVTVPCCGAALTVLELRFEDPVGFARFEVSAMNWTRGSWELSDEERAAVEEILGHPVKQVDTRY